MEKEWEPESLHTFAWHIADEANLKVFHEQPPCKTVLRGYRHERD